MKNVVAAVLALAFTGTMAFATPVVVAKKCPEGKILNEDTGKCVTPRGS